LHSSKLLSKLNFIYPISINEIKIKGEKKQWVKLKIFMQEKY
jgi:hypothetical protein